MKVLPDVLYKAREGSTWIWSKQQTHVGVGPQRVELYLMRNCDMPRLPDQWVTARGCWYISESMQSDKDLIGVCA